MKLFKKIFKSKKNPPVVVEKLPDLSIWNHDENGEPTTPIYIETDMIADEPNSFRLDYCKVVMCIKSANHGLQINTCRKMFNCFVRKWELDQYSTDSATLARQRMFSQSICGYIENLLQQEETKYQINPVVRSI